MDKPCKYNMKPMEEFVTEDIHPDRLSELLDEVSFDYTLRYFYENDNCPPFKDAAENLYLLRELRDIFRKMTVKEE